MHLAETGLCQHGEQEALIQSGATRIGGRLPINTDGGCLACGEPIGASGLRQVHEVALQLRGEAGRPPDPGAGAGRFHPGVRGPRGERVHRAEHLSGALARSRRLVLPELLARGGRAQPQRPAMVFGGVHARTPSCTTAPRGWRRRSWPPACGRAIASGCCSTTASSSPSRCSRAIASARVAVPINFRLTADEIAYILEDSGAVALIAGTRPDGLRPPAGRLESGPATRRRSRRADRRSRRTLHEHDPALLCYTSGTTGRPKGAILSHANLVAATLSWIHEMRAGADDVWLSGQPLFHIGGINGMLPFLALGATSILLPTRGSIPRRRSA